MKEYETIIGYHAAIAVLKNPLRKIISMKCTKEFFKKNKDLIGGKKISDFKIVNRKTIDLECKNNFHQGVIINSSFLKNHNLNSISSDEKNIIILDSLNDSQNVGAIIRTAYLFGIKTIIYNKDNSFEINPHLIKASSGAFEKIKLIEVTNINRIIEKLKDLDFWIVGLDINSSGNLNSIPRDLKKVLIFGSEDRGIRSSVLKKCDFMSKIDLPNKEKFIDSLNVSNSVAIVLYECTKNE